MPDSNESYIIYRCSIKRLPTICCIISISSKNITDSLKHISRAGHCASELRLKPHLHEATRHRVDTQLDRPFDADICAWRCTFFCHKLQQHDFHQVGSHEAQSVCCNMSPPLNFEFSHISNAIYNKKYNLTFVLIY